MTADTESRDACPRLAEKTAEIARDNERFDYFELQLRNRESGRSLRSFGRLLGDAAATVWSAARRPFLASLVLTVLTALVAVAQVLITMQLLDRLLASANAGHLDLALVTPQVVALGALMAAGFVGSAANIQLKRLLGQLVTRDTQRKILDVTTGLSLDAYETPWFFNYVILVETNALAKPLEIVQAVLGLVSGMRDAATSSPVDTMS